MAPPAPTPSTRGSFRANWRDPSGRQRAKSFKTAKAAKAFLAEVEASLNKGLYVDPSAGRLTFETLAQLWLEGRTVEATTDAATRSRVQVHLLPDWGSWPVNKIDHMAVQTWVAGLARRGLAAATVASVFGNFSSIMKSAVRNRLIAVNPCEDVQLPARRQRADDRVTITRDELTTKLLPAVPELHRAVVAVAGGAGLRWGECAGLRWGSVDLEAGTVAVVEVLTEVSGRVVMKPFPKTAAGRRVIPLPAFVLAVLHEHREIVPPNSLNLVFPGERGAPQRRGNFRQRVWLDVVTRSGLPTRLRFHDLRHSYATWLVSEGVPVNIVQRLLGHSRASVTLDRYTHSRPTSTTVYGVPWATTGLADNPLTVRSERPQLQRRQSPLAGAVTREHGSWWALLGLNQ